MPQADESLQGQLVNNESQASSMIRDALLENRGRFLNLLQRKLRSPDIAAEVFQTFCERALRKGRSLRDQRSTVPWLYQILRSCLADYLRAELNRQRFEAEYAAQQDIVSERIHVDTYTSACACLYEALPKLRADYAEVLLKLDLEGDDRSNTAQRLGITANNISVRLHRARQAMRRALLLICNDCLDDGFLNCACGPVPASTAGSARAAK